MNYKIDTIKKSFKRVSYTMSSLLLLTALAVPILFYRLYYLEFSKSGTPFLIIMPAFYYALSMIFQYKPVLSKRTSLDKLSDKMIGKIPLEAFQAAVKEIFTSARQTNEEIPAVYISHGGTYGNTAYTIDLLFLNIFKPLNAIYIPERYFSLLTIEELKSILAHEMAHFRFYMNPLSRAWYLILLLKCLLPAYIIFSAGAAHCWYAYLLYIPAYKITSIAINVISHFREKHTEYLSDYYSAVKYGKLNMINALLILGKYNESIHYIRRSVLGKIITSNNIPFDAIPEIIKIIDDQIPEKIVSKTLIGRRINEAFRSEKIKRLEKSLSPEELQKRDSKLYKYRFQFFTNYRGKLLPWKLFDFHVKDWRIDEVEYPHLIKALKDYPKKQLFDLIYDNIKDTRRFSHPTWRERILFLHNNIKELNEESASSHK